VPIYILKIAPALAAAVVLVASLAGCQSFADAITGGNSQGGNGQPAAANSATVIRVIDGDTIAVQPSDAFPPTNDAGSEHVIRLLGIDTPEMNVMSEEDLECGAQNASDQLAALLPAGAAVSIIFDADADRSDRYGRSLAYVQLADGTDAALALASTGYAEAWYPQGEPEPERFAAYAAAEDNAASSNLGSHSMCDSIGR